MTGLGLAELTFAASAAAGRVGRTAPVLARSFSASDRFIDDSDPHPFANHRPAVPARRADAELPRRLANCAREVRAGRILAEFDAIVDAVVGDRPAGDQAPAVGGVS